MAENLISIPCCIAGGGPAGMMLGLLLARAGVDVLVLEKHADFLRDFRGDSIHPSTLKVMEELGLLEDLLKLPHQKAFHLSAYFRAQMVTIADFSHLPLPCRYIAFMPQWDFLNFLVARAKRYSAFKLIMQAEVIQLIEKAGKIAGLYASTPEGPLAVRADLVVGADGRHSVIRTRADLEVIEYGVPMDVLWFRLPRHPSDPEDPMGRFDADRILVMINRGTYWQCGYVIPKGSFGQIRERGLNSFRKDLASFAPFDAARFDHLQDWDEIKLLTVQVDRLLQWYRPGLLMIGDAAHAMSPVGGVGINLAIQDAVAAANLLAEPLRSGRLTDGDLRRVQRRREFPTRATQWMQLSIQNQIFKLVRGKTGVSRHPGFFRLFASLPFLSHLTGRLIGMGFRPEHIQSFDILSKGPI